MITLKFALIALMIGSSTYAPLQIGHMNLPGEQPAAQVELLHHTDFFACTEAIRTEAIKDTSNGQFINEQPVPKRIVEDMVVEDMVTAPETNPLINMDKTYEQVMAEAFEHIYAKINKMLDQIPESAKDQFQLQMMA